MPSFPSTSRPPATPHAPSPFDLSPSAATLNGEVPVSLSVTHLCPTVAISRGRDGNSVTHLCSSVAEESPAVTSPLTACPPDTRWPPLHPSPHKTSPNTHKPQIRNRRLNAQPDRTERRTINKSDANTPRAGYAGPPNEIFSLAINQVPYLQPPIRSNFRYEKPLDRS
jgi:hypothetical protein